MRLARIAWAFLRSAVQHELAYRADFFGNVVRSLLGTGTAFGGLMVVFSHTESLGDWSFPQMLGLLGVFYVVQGVMAVFMSPSLNKTVEEVREGTFDYILVKPVPSQFIASTRRFVLWHVTDVALGVAIIVIAASRLEDEVSLIDVLVFLAMIFTALSIVYAMWLSLTTLVFWWVRMENVTMIFNVFYETGRYPVEIFPFWLRQALTFIFPVAFITTVPARAITGREASWLTWIAPVVAIVVVLAASKFWRIGLSRYSSASS